MRSYTAYAYSAGTCGATKNAGMENAGLENARSNSRGGRKYRTGKHGNIMCMGSEA